MGRPPRRPFSSKADRAALLVRVIFLDSCDAGCTVGGQYDVALAPVATPTIPPTYRGVVTEERHKAAADKISKKVRSVPGRDLLGGFYQRTIVTSGRPSARALTAHNPKDTRPDTSRLRQSLFFCRYTMERLCPQSGPNRQRNELKAMPLHAPAGSAIGQRVTVVMQNLRGVSRRITW